MNRLLWLAALFTFIAGESFAQTLANSQELGVLNFNQYYNGSNVIARTTGYSGMIYTDPTTGNFVIETGGTNSAGATVTRAPIVTVTATPGYKLEVAGNVALSAITNAYYLAGNKILHQPASDTTSFGVGPKALASQTIVNRYNTAVGFEALYSTSGGANYGWNTAVGYQALRSLTGESPSWANTAVGYKALYNTTTGWNNTAIGYQALKNNLTGGNNIAIGYDALRETTTGSYNIAIGSSALVSSYVGNRNTIVGISAASEGGDDNTVVGASAVSLLTSPASNNTVLGAWAGHNGDEWTGLQGGNNNVLIGYAVGSTTLDSGSFNILIGTSSAVDTTASNSSNQLNIGNTIYADMAGARLGIFTASPQATLDVNGYAKLKTNSSAPVACSATYKGSIAYTGGTTNYLCFCDGTSWKQAHSPATACTW